MPRGRNFVRHSNLRCLTLQRHFSASTKFAHGKSWFCVRKQREKADFCTPINHGARSVYFRSVAIGLIKPCFVRLILTVVLGSSETVALHPQYYSYKGWYYIDYTSIIQFNIGLSINHLL